jgi:hypothetical protein
MLMGESVQISAPGLAPEPEMVFLRQIWCPGVDSEDAASQQPPAPIALSGVLQLSKSFQKAYRYP